MTGVGWLGFGISALIGAALYSDHRAVVKCVREDCAGKKGRALEFCRYSCETEEVHPNDPSLKRSRKRKARSG